MKIIVTGANGMLGKSLLPKLYKHNVIGVGQNDFDITDEVATFRFITENKPELVIHCAAYTDVDGCETNTEHAYKVNALGTKNIVTACENVDAALLFISTDYVFDGEKQIAYVEDDLTNPLSVYGKTKLEAEWYVKKLARHFICRTQWLFGDGKNFVDTIIQLSKTKSELSIVADQFGCPTYVNDLSDAISKLIESNDYGVYHLTNTGIVSWYEFAKEILLQLNITHVQLNAVTSDEFKRPANRPPYSPLNNCNWEKKHTPLRSYRAALKDYLEAKQ